MAYTPVMKRAVQRVFACCLLLLAVTTSLACEGGDCSVRPAGLACIVGEGNGSEIVLEEGRRLRVRTGPGGCFSSSCSRVDQSSTCSLTKDGNKLTATGKICIEDTSGSSKGCSLDCNDLATTECETDEPLPAGDYTLTIGTAELSFTIPSVTQGRLCAGAAF